MRARRFGGAASKVAHAPVSTFQGEKNCESHYKRLADVCYFIQPSEVRCGGRDFGMENALRKSFELQSEFRATKKNVCFWKKKDLFLVITFIAENYIAEYRNFKNKHISGVKLFVKVETKFVFHRTEHQR